MNFTAIFCCYVLLPYFASLVFPAHEAITCHAGTSEWMKKLKNGFECLFNRQGEASFAHISNGGQSKDQTPKIPLEDKYFLQKRDHFHHTDSEKWQQRYLIYDDHYRGNGVIFLRICTEDNITAWHMQNGRWFDYCRNAKALCIGIERRGFGKSLLNRYLKNENLIYLNTEQTLADIAWFVYNFRRRQTGFILPKKLKWVAYGSFEEGALAAWLRMKYPHLVHAALSLSAPLLAKEEYDDDEKFKAKNIELMYFLLAQTLAVIIQYSNDDMDSMKNKATEIMLGETRESQRLKTSMNRFAEVVKLNLKRNNKKCLQVNYNAVILGYKIKTDSGYYNFDYLLRETFGNRMTLYQSCYEFGRFETFKKFFETSIELRFFTKFCKDVFGERYSLELLEKGVRRTNMFYGGLNIVVSRVIFVYGYDDPYRDLGVISVQPEKCMTRILTGAKYCYELDEYKKITPGYDVKQDIYDQLKQWLDLSENNKADEDQKLNEKTGE